ncbi:hypothetical protein GCM10012275_01910 [Longimycelium tulufanense]|uniref:Phthiocerol/phthiodiolone dimycocerosyl transferase n=1 Tax=Longimycelium tulufanense TaxID=907463 RepID=A0A8J3FTH2_9PSEU|nr:short-chain dehydrogenase [Longimycelium tulufanense]GGM34170.1 hypothetical protein GCM10012275_01910 [Longimycelium tulufanense]
MINRPLSPAERWYWLCDQLSPLNCIVRVHIAGAVSCADLERAAAGLVAEHPLLRVAVAAAPDGTRPRFVPVKDPRIPIRTVTAEDPGRWEREIDGVELVTPLATRSGPLARIVDIIHAPGSAQECHDLILTVSHIIADGTAVMEMLRRLLELAAGTPSPEPHDPLPPPEAMLPRWIKGVPRTLQTVAWAVADQIATAIARPRRLVPDTPVPAERRRTRLVHRELDAEQLDRLVSRCKREGLTVHSALTATMAIAVAGEDARCVTLGSPVDFRAELVRPVGSRDLGSYVATVPSHIRIGPLWATARRAQRDLNRRTRFGQHLALISMLRFMTPPSVGRSARTIAMVDRMGPGNVCLSNLGRFPFPDRVGEWDVSGIQPVAGLSISGLLVAVVITSHSALSWNFSYIEGALIRERAERIADRAVEILLSSIGG